MSRKAGMRAQIVPATGESNYVKQIFILSFALLLRGALSLLHGSGPAAGRTTLPPVATRRPSVFSNSCPTDSRSSRSVANLIPPEMNTI